MSETPKSSNASLIGGLVAAVVLALGVGVLVYRQPGPAPPVAPLPSPSAEATPAPESSPEASPAASDAGTAPAASAPGAASGTAKPKAGSAAASSGAKPSASQPAAGKGTTTGKPADKASLGGPRGTSGAPPPLTSQAMMRRTFVASRTASENVKGVSKTLSGFDAKKGKDVQVKRAPEIDARIEFSSTPQRVKPGDKYKIRVAFVNEGKRTIEIKELVVTTKINGKESRETVKPLTRVVESRQNEVLYEIAGTWDRSTTTWSVSAEVLSNQLDAYRNQVVWK